MVTELTETVYARYEFTPEELLGISREMARAESDKSELQDELKAVTSQIKSKIDAKDAVLHKCAEQVRSGYEMRPYVCKISYDDKQDSAIYTDIKTGEIIQKRPMSRDEQMRLTRQNFKG